MVLSTNFHMYVSLLLMEAWTQSWDFKNSLGRCGVILYLGKSPLKAGFGYASCCHQHRSVLCTWNVWFPRWWISDFEWVTLGLMIFKKELFRWFVWEPTVKRVIIFRHEISSGGTCIRSGKLWCSENKGVCSALVCQVWVYFFVCCENRVNDLMTRNHHKHFQCSLFDLWCDIV